MNYTGEYQEMVFGSHPICSVVLINSIFLTVLLSVAPTILCFRFLHGRWTCCNCSWASLWLAVFIYRSTAGSDVSMICFDRWMCIRAAKRACGRRELYLVFIMLRSVNPLSQAALLKYCQSHSWSLCLYEFFFCMCFCALHC